MSLPPLEPSSDGRPAWPEGAESSGVTVPPAGRRDRVWLHVVLALAALATMTDVGRLFYLSYLLDLVPRPLMFTSARDVWVGGLWYSLSGLAIVLAHEFGHYFACRYYRVDASLPYLLPFPNLLGTMGAVIRIRSAIPHRKALFDIGVAGPLAGFAVALALLVAGVAMSRVVRFPENLSGIEFGEPLVFKAVVWARWGHIPEGFTLNLHPMGFAAWVGCFLTVFNLMPIWQLDGGHVTYALFGRRSAYVTAAAIVCCFLMAVAFTWQWALWGLLFAGLIVVFGPHHAPTIDDSVPLGTTRTGIALAVAAVFALCFMPVPFDFIDLVRR